LVLAYQQLRGIAAVHLARESPGQTLQPTALVHEAWLRLGAREDRAWQGSKHFVAAASEAMRLILVDRARGKLRQKRGGNRERVEFDDNQWLDPGTDAQVLEVDAAVQRLQLEDPDLAQVVKLRFFAGLNHDEIAAALEINERTVRRRWELARLRLYQWIRDGEGAGVGG
jgi:RNA polymerase sigma factor (TIGR02999 family)